jgi:hypothetical protein
MGTEYPKVIYHSSFNNGWLTAHSLQEEIELKVKVDKPIDFKLPIEEVKTDFVEQQQIIKKRGRPFKKVGTI